MPADTVGSNAMNSDSICIRPFTFQVRMSGAPPGPAPVTTSPTPSPSRSTTATDVPPSNDGSNAKKSAIITCGAFSTPNTIVFSFDPSITRTRGPLPGPALTTRSFRPSPFASPTATLHPPRRVESNA